MQFRQKKEKKQPQTYADVTTWDVMREYLKTCRPFAWLGILAAIGSSVAFVSQSVVVPIFYKRFFDTLATATDVHAAGPLLAHVIFIVLGLNFIVWIGYRVSGFTLVYFEVRVMKKLREHAFEYMIGHSLSFFANNFTGSLVQKINRYMRSFERLTDHFFWDILSLVLKVTGSCIVLYIIDPPLAYALFIWVVVFLAFSYATSRLKLKYDLVAAELDSKTTGVLSDVITDHNAVQLFTGTDEEADNFRKVNNDQAKINLKRWNIGSFSDAGQSLLSLGIEFFVFYYGIKYWQLGLVTLGTFTLVQAYIIGIGANLWSFGRVVRDIYESIADAKEMVLIMHQEHSITDLLDASTLIVDKGSIDFRDVSFSFTENREVVKGITIHVRPGEKVAIIGSSGAGKSTIVKLIMRLYDINKGSICIDGQNIAEVTQESLRENVSLVPQDPALFHRTLMENIRYGKRTATDAEVVRAAKLAHCDEFIESFPNKYETLVGERGIKLSGGERQRVAIARAIIKNAPILVLDEATSSLDSHSEKLIQDALRILMKGKTTIVIAHRLSTIKQMDRIIVMDHGAILEEGTHDELIKKTGGMYAKLWSLQAGGFSGQSIEELYATIEK